MRITLTGLKGCSPHGYLDFELLNVTLRDDGRLAEEKEWGEIKGKGVSPMLLCDLRSKLTDEGTGRTKGRNDIFRN